MALLVTLKAGQRYLQNWPLNPKLAMIFAENRVIKATRFAERVMPFIAVFAICWQQLYGKGEIMALAASILTAIFALCIPLQGLYWLGKRAQTKLPDATVVVFKDILIHLEQKGINRIVPVEPRFQDLAEVLRLAESHFSSDFWESI